MITEREADCLDLRIHGLASKQIASELGIVHQTVNVHFANALKHTGCKSSYHLIAEYIAGRVKITPPKGLK